MRKTAKKYVNILNLHSTFNVIHIPCSRLII